MDKNVSKMEFIFHVVHMYFGWLEKSCVNFRLSCYSRQEISRVAAHLEKALYLTEIIHSEAILWNLVEDFKRGWLECLSLIHYNCTFWSKISLINWGDNDTENFGGFCHRICRPLLCYTIFYYRWIVIDAVLYFTAVFYTNFLEHLHESWGQFFLFVFSN